MICNDVCVCVCEEISSHCSQVTPPPPLLGAMTSSMLRRQLKNLVQNYSEAEVKVTETGELRGPQ